MPLDRSSELAARFDTLDINGSGELEMNELQGAFDDMAGQFIEYCDANKDKSITKDEFINAIIHDTEDLSDADFTAAWLTRLDGTIKTKGIKRQEFLANDLTRVKQAYGAAPAVEEAAPAAEEAAPAAAEEVAPAAAEEAAPAAAEEAAPAAAEEAAPAAEEE